MIGYIRMTDGAEQDGVGGPQQIQRVLRRHAAVREIILRAPVEVLEAAGEVVLSSRAIENLLRRWNDFLANAVAGDYCYIQFAQPTKLTCFGLGIEAFEFEGPVALVYRNKCICAPRTSTMTTT